MKNSDTSHSRRCRC